MKNKSKNAADEPPKAKSAIEEDPRFASMARDPRFASQPKKKATVAIDKRFTGMFDDPDFQVTTSVDKRGRKVDQKKKGEDLKRYYHIEGEEEGERQSTAKKHQSKPSELKKSADNDGNDDVGEEEEEEEEEEETRRRFLRARGMLDESSSDEDASEDAEIEEDIGQAEAEADEEEWGVGAMAANPDEDIPMVDATPRIAIVDLDWDHVKAVDILAVLRSFAPKGGLVKKVTVYPSDYGLERMAEEAALGPKKVFQKQSKGHAHVAAEREKKQSDDKAKGKKPSKDEEDDEEGGDAELVKKRLAMYEKSKLRWFYAVAECDNLSTSSRVYTECDGLEFERSACKFDLRFIPDGLSFEGRQIRDSASSVPTGYEPPDVFNLSLQHTDPKLSWDADDDSRKKVLQKKMNEDDIKEGDFEAYLGSEQDDDDDQEDEQERAAVDPKDKAEKIRERYRSLLLGGKPKEDSRGKSWGAEDDDDDDQDEEEKEEEGGGNKEASARIRGRDGMDMEVTFVSGLESLGDKLLSKKKEEEMRKGETVWEAYLRKKKEKRKEKKHGRKVTQDDSSDSDYDDNVGGDEVKEGSKKGGMDEEDPFDDPFFKDGGAEGVPVDSEDEEMDEDEAEEERGGRGRSLKKHKLSKEMGSKGEKKSLVLAEKQEEKRRQELSKAELELLLMDDDALKEAAERGLPGAVKGASRSSRGGNEEEEDKTGSGKKRMSRKERLRMKKEQRRDARQGSDDEDAGKDEDEGFKADLEDPRFKQLVQDHEFALDPTDPRFVGSKKGSESLLKKLSKKKGKINNRGDRTQADEPPMERPKSKLEAPAKEDVEGVDKLELRNMVNKLKRKAERS